MPKVVDHEQRRREIADALWSVVQRDGVGAASVRSIAAEGGWSTGSLRHYFSSQSELMAFAMVNLTARVRERVAKLGPRANTIEGVAALLESVLPVDVHTRAETEVWVALIAAARTDPDLREVAVTAHRDLRSLVRSCVVHIATLSGRDLDERLETDRLQALIDGLALHGSLYPQQMPTKRIKAALRMHLASLGQAP